VSLDLATIAERFKRAGAVAPPPDVPEPAPRAAVEGPPAPGPLPPLGSVADRPAPEGPAPVGRRPRRRRWQMPGSPTERQQAVVDPPPAELHPCPFCGERHQPVRLGGGGLLAYAQPIAAAPWETGRPRPRARRH
jgi:hypothetical protein